MKILCVAATRSEIAPFLEQKPAADHLVTGVGAPMALYHIAKRIQQTAYDLVIQAGIAGSFDTSLELGETVFVSKDNFADIGVSEQQRFLSLFDMGFLNNNEFPFTGGWLENKNIVPDLFPLQKLPAITVNTVTDNATQIKMLKTKYAPVVESMEGAALHYACLNEGVAFMQLRSISNYVGERDKSKWKIKTAIENLNNSLIKIIEHLDQQNDGS